MKPTLLGRIGTVSRFEFEYCVRACTEGGYFKQCSFGSDVELTKDEAIQRAKRVMGDCYGAHEWEVERL